MTTIPFVQYFTNYNYLVKIEDVPYGTVNAATAMTIVTTAIRPTQESHLFMGATMP